MVPPTCRPQLRIIIILKEKQKKEKKRNKENGKENEEK